MYDTPLSYPTPFALLDHPQAGVEIQANAMLTILRRSFIQPPRAWETVLLVLLLTPLFGRIFGWCRVRTGVVLLAFVLAGTFYRAFMAYHRFAVPLQFASLLIAFSLTWLGNTLDWYLHQKRRTAATRSMFQRFVSPEVVQQILERPETVRPGGQKTTLTVFFSDLAGFSTFSELLTPEQLVMLLNEYLGRMTQIIFKHGGTLDKFIGDAVMAFWNYPCPQKDHALRGCLCALEMRETIKSLREDWKKRQLPAIHARAGLNTAEAIVGFMGDEKTQMNFTCMGDGVNLASRLEGAIPQRRNSKSSIGIPSDKEFPEAPFPETCL
ncbi:MAG: adenylate/guanylate cyclase domain-containing protein [Candidatus Ozemobacteraceae bacterium]